MTDLERKASFKTIFPVDLKYPRNCLLTESLTDLSKDSRIHKQPKIWVRNSVRRDDGRKTAHTNNTAKTCSIDTQRRKKCQTTKAESFLRKLNSVERRSLAIEPSGHSDRHETADAKDSTPVRGTPAPPNPHRRKVSPNPGRPV